jgi:hypothetical protein
VDKEFKDQIIASRPTNIGRLIGGLVFIFISYLYDLYELYIVAIIYIIVGSSWLYLVEKHYTIYARHPRFWYFNAFIDIFTLSVFVYLTGTTHSFVIVGYIVITTLSSIDLNIKRGRFAAFGSSIFYIIIVLLVYTERLPYINILTNNNSEKVTLFAVIISIVLLLLANVVVNLVVYNIYNKLNETNIEVNNKYEEIKQLKFQQDGDYYLTSLLIEPIFETIEYNDKILIETYISQYKKFSFRNENREIGGDIVLHDNITLGDQEYTVFINADAMGKSIQGAGGALVFGVILKTLLSRTKQEVQCIKPEDWILETYNELQKIFESFDGLMLVSAILGLIEKSSGIVYFLNLDHPDIILYKNKKAIYIKPASTNSKIGMPYIQLPKSVDKFTLEDGDILILGSDGKDDLKKASENAHDMYNYDENLFLKIVEDHSANLKELIKNIDQYGKIIDDISLLKIVFHNNKNIENKKK